MRFMVIVKCSGRTRKPSPRSLQLMADLNKFNDELLEAGISIGYDGLHPSSKGARVHFSGKNRPTVIDGPFVESKELIATFWFWQVGLWKRRSSGSSVAPMKARPT